MLGTVLTVFAFVFWHQASLNTSDNRDLTTSQESVSLYNTINFIIYNPLFVFTKIYF